MKPFLVLSIVLGFLFQGNSCGREADDKWVKLSGPNDPASLVVFFKRSTTEEQINNFLKTVVGRTRSDGKGYDLVDGVAGTMYVRNSDYEGYAIQFGTDATPEQRQNLKKAIKESPIVYRVYENFVPNEIKGL